MTPPVSLDEIDEQIITLLAENGRRSNRAIGRTLSISESMVRKRLKRMIDGDVISYGVLVDVSMLGKQCAGYLSVRCVPAHTQTVADTIAASEDCVMCGIGGGAFGIRAYVYAETVEQMSSTCEAISNLEGVREVNFRPLAHHARHRYQYIIWSENERADRQRVGSQ